MKLCPSCGAVMRCLKPGFVFSISDTEAMIGDLFGCTLCQQLSIFDILPETFPSYDDYDAYDVHGELVYEGSITDIYSKGSTSAYKTILNPTLAFTPEFADWMGRWTNAPDRCTSC